MLQKYYTSVLLACSWGAITQVFYYSVAGGYYTSVLLVCGWGNITQVLY